jgi:hypothetical protein
MTYSLWPWRFLSLLSPNIFGTPANGTYQGYANYWEDAIYVGVLPLLLAARSVGRWWAERRAGTVSPAGQVIPFIRYADSEFVVAGRMRQSFLAVRSCIGFDIIQAPTRVTVLAVFGLAVLAELEPTDGKLPRADSPGRGAPLW